MLSKSLFECSFSRAYVVFPGCVFVCCHFSVVDNVSGEAVVVQGAVLRTTKQTTEYNGLSSLQLNHTTTSPKGATSVHRKNYT